MNHIIILILIISFQFGLKSCQSNSNDGNKPQDTEKNVPVEKESSLQIADYLLGIFEDSKGNLWFGTISKGAAFYDGTSLRYFTKKDGLPSNMAKNFIEDNEGNVWISTQAGLSKYDGNSFTNYSDQDGLPHPNVSQILIDSKGVFWVGTWGGVCTFDGQRFTHFKLPIPNIELEAYQTTMDWNTEIMEDSEGNIWFGRDGYGACRFDGKDFTHFTKKDGLLSNNITGILDDGKGHIWFASRIAEKDHPDEDKRFGPSGVSVYDGKSMKQFPEVGGLSNSDIYLLSKDQSDNIWIGVNHLGVYKYDDGNFRLFNQFEDRKSIKKLGITSMLDDSKGNHWFGLVGGLYRLEDDAFKNITTHDFDVMK